MHPAARVLLVVACGLGSRAAAEGPEGGHDSQGPRHRRPLCDAYRRKHWAHADGAFLTRSRGHFAMRDDGSRAYDVKPCRIVRYGAEAARRCLRGRHLFFIGDSITRYQVMSLIHFLERGEWPKRLTGGSGTCVHAPTDACDPGPSITAEGDWRTQGQGAAWANMLSSIGGGADGSIFRGRVECLCARDDSMTDRPASRGGGWATTQNVVYRGEFGVNVTFVEQNGWHGTEQLQGWTPTGCANNGTCRLTLAGHAKNVARANADDYDWAAPLLQALDGPLPRLYPDVTDVFYNRGLWGEVKEPDQVFARLHNLVAPKGGRCFWRGTTSGGGQGKRDERPVREAAAKAGCESFDANHVATGARKRPVGAPRRSAARPRAGHERLRRALLHTPATPPGNREARAERRPPAASLVVFFYVALLPPTTQVYWDKVHFQPWVYEELNNLLLNVLC